MPATVILAKDDLLIKEEAHALAGGQPVHTYFLDDISYADFYRIVGTDDLFNPAQFFHCTSLASFRVLKADLPKLGALLDGLGDAKHVVFSQNCSFEDYRDEPKFIASALYKLVAGKAKVIDRRKPMSHDDAVTWVARRAQREYGLVLDRAGAAFLWQACAKGPVFVDRELAKFALFKEDDRPAPISETFIRNNVYSTLANLTFDFIDHLMEKNTRVYDDLKHLFQSGIEPGVLLSQAHRRLALLAKSHLSSVEEDDDFRRMAPWQRDRFMRSRRNWSAAQAAGALELVADADFKLKMSYSAGDTARQANQSLFEVFLRRVMS
jgi:hypothetical protein